MNGFDEKKTFNPLLYLVNKSKRKEAISMISNYFCQMLDMGRQQLPILKMGKNKNNKIK